MENNVLKSALIKLRNSLEEGPKPNYYNTGICGELCNMLDFDLLSHEEFIEAKKFIESNKPSEYRHPEFLHYGSDCFWWPKMNSQLKLDGRKIRVMFLNKLISSLEVRHRFEDIPTSLLKKVLKF